MKIFNTKNPNRRHILTLTIGAVLLLSIVILLNMIFNNINFGRFDLTADSIYSISPSVKKIFTDLEAPIEATYYVSASEKMPTDWKNLEQDVQDLLKELQINSNSMLTYKTFDPSKEEQKEALRNKDQDKEESLISDQKNDNSLSRKRIAERLYEKGVIPFGVRSTNKDEFAIKRIYSSIILSYLDRKEEVIAEIRPTTFGNLEYEIMSRIYKLISNKRPEIGFYPSTPEIPPQYRQYYRQAPPDMYTTAVQLLKESGYNVTRTNIKEDDPIPENIKTMILMLDNPLNERQLYEIDKLIHAGIHVIMAGQMFNYQISPSRKPGEFDLRGMPTRLNINDLTRNYGFEIDNQMFMDKSTTFIQVPVYKTKKMGMFQVQQQRFEPVTKPILIKVEPRNINNKISISNGINTLFYMYGNRLILHDDQIKSNKLNHKILFTSSNYSWTRKPFGYGGVNIDPPEPDKVLKHEPLGLFIEGKFPAKFTDTNIPEWPAEKESQGETESDTVSKPSEITGEINNNKIILYGCSNLFKNNVLESITSHKSLLLNSVDALTLGDELINIRSKNFRARKIKEVGSTGKAATKIFVTGLPIAIFIFTGFYINIRRKRNKRGINT